MEKVIVNVAKTPAGYTASIDILPAWILGMSGSFDDLEKELQESVAIFVEWAKEDGDEYPTVFDSEYAFEYKFNAESLQRYNETVNDGAMSRRGYEFAGRTPVVEVYA
jgi:hypothetical protein